MAYTTINTSISYEVTPATSVTSNLKANYYTTIDTYMPAERVANPQICTRCGAPLKDREYGMKCEYCDTLYK